MNQQKKEILKITEKKNSCFRFRKLRTIFKRKGLIKNRFFEFGKLSLGNESSRNQISTKSVE